MACHRGFLATALVALTCGTAQPGMAQDLHAHTRQVSGMPQGLPILCGAPTVTSTARGAWSDGRTWSTQRVPGANDRVEIPAGHHITYDSLNETTLDCIEVRGQLTFPPDKNARMRVGTLVVSEEGHLEIGNATKPIAPHVTVDLVIADQPINPATDPNQVGTGLIGLGKVTMHGAVKMPTFMRLGREPLAGDTVIELEQPVGGWMPGDHVVIPDTRQLRA